MIFSEKLINLRRKNGLSQDDLADKLGVSRQAIYKWENSQAKPEVAKLVVLSKIFNVTLDSLLDDESGLVYKKSTQPTVASMHITERASAPVPTQPKYGKVYLNALPDENSAEEDYMILPPAQTKKYKTRKTIRSIFNWTTLIAFLVPFVLAIVLGTEEEIGKFLVFIASCVFYFYVLLFFPKMFVLDRPIKKLEKNREYFYRCKEAYEKYLSSKGYLVIPLQPDSFQWFFYDKERESFGLFFNKQEQFICPIRNFVNVDCVGYGEGNEEIGLNLMPSFLVGSVVGVGVNASSKTMHVLPVEYEYKINYANEKGDLQMLVFRLTSLRKYVTKTCKAKKKAILDYYNGISYQTYKSYKEIKDLLNFEKSKLKN